MYSSKRETEMTSNRLNLIILMFPILVNIRSEGAVRTHFVAWNRLVKDQ